VIYEDLYEISKLLLAEDDAERAPEVLLRRLVERCGAETGFVVVREDGSYQQKFEVGEERGRRSDLERRFSRTLVREAIATGALLYLPNLIEDPRFAAGESGLVIGRCCVLVAPLRYDGEVYGVVYLENRERVDSFTPESRAFLTELACSSSGRATARSCGGATAAWSATCSPSTTSRGSSPAIPGCSSCCGSSRRWPARTLRSSCWARPAPARS
jgi:transcriptional regulator with GAF, ATPase, and Fis domain